MSTQSKNIPCGTVRVLTLVSLISTAFGASAQTASSENPQMLAPVVVSASRFPNDPAFAPIGATVITAEDIRDSGASDINEAIRRTGGIYGRQNLSGTSDFSLDLRGFGENSERNMVVLVDGVRISENELVSTAFASIPVNAVERIEIVRGGSSVLYGEGATGGTINIITNRNYGNELQGMLMVEAGSFDHREVRASASKGWDQFSTTVNVSKRNSDNYRENNRAEEETFNGGVQWKNAKGGVGLRVELARQDTRLPGSLSPSEFRQNPRQSNTPDDFGVRDLDRYVLSASRQFGDVEIAAELAHSEKFTRGYFVDQWGISDIQADVRTTQFSPRVRHLYDFSGGRNELVAGLDLMRWTNDADSFYNGAISSRARYTQESVGAYVRNEIRVGRARLAAGVRHEKFDKDAAHSTANSYSLEHSLNGVELQGSYEFSDLHSAYVKGGRSYRVPTADENRSFSGGAPLQPQISRDIEAGMTYGDKQSRIVARVFQHRLTDEIGYDPTIGFVGENINLDPTTRRGVEMELKQRVAVAWTIAANVQHVSAKFSEGAYVGRRVPLVPRNSAMLRMHWQPAGKHTAHAGIQWVDSQYFGGDFANSCGSKIPSHTTLDARYAYRQGPWEFAVTGSNLTDKDYFTNGFVNGACTLSIYPDAGRQLKFSVRREF